MLSARAEDVKYACSVARELTVKLVVILVNLSTPKVLKVKSVAATFTVGEVK